MASRHCSLLLKAKFFCDKISKFDITSEFAIFAVALTGPVVLNTAISASASWDSTALYKLLLAKYN